MDRKTNPLTIIRRLFAALQPAEPGTYYLYVQHLELRICRYPDYPRDFPVVARFNSNDINNGLSSHHWNKIAAKIRMFIKQGIIEWQPP